MNFLNLGFFPGNLFRTVEIPLNDENKWTQGTTQVLYILWQPFVE